ncbi:L,D-transpeptidase scaffold domain-containing protein [Anaeromyxobacter paludicola]|uniref:L,D-TPase catalytic domain-containing protein n=1 Tax=Anaeromyxobacter paludicola TaxID=2918171 RepID=A0ABN6N7I9_9BACT|nr:L,D-transpeptidase family protein [Anaeromyxobacter paludicola]BDG09146.1 hypothetical protein AMPC_22590 [Anaeromyxobacter paludicola]
MRGLGAGWLLLALGAAPGLASPEELWLSPAGPTPQALAVVDALRRAGEKGLVPDDYDGPRWAERLSELARSPAAPEPRARFDEALTAAALRYASDLARGRPVPGRPDLRAAFPGAPALDLLAFVRDRLAAGPDPAAALAELEPPFAAYRRTLAALAERRRLAAGGDPARVAEVHKLELTLERWRWLPRRFEAPPMVVNIPAFELTARDPGSGRRVAMKVVVGKAYGLQTPALAASLTEVVFRPAWNVPASIQRKELVPRLARDPGLLEREGYELVDRQGRVAARALDPAGLQALRAGTLRLRQRPGPKNALGAVKFVFPNPHGIYLHGTPAVALFARGRRDLSHGCVRVEDPLALAEWVLRGLPDWPRARIAAAMAGPEPRRVRLTRAIPVLLVYGTAVVGEDGTARFFEDVYGHDAALDRALAAGRGWGRRPAGSGGPQGAVAQGAPP